MSPIANSTSTVQPLHQHFRTELLTAHCALRRSLESIIQHAPNVAPKQQEHFLVFCNTFIEFLHEHHTIEDTICFPLLVGPCGVQDDIEKLETEHDTMIELIKDMKESLQLPTYNGAKIAVCATALKTMMYKHLEFEENVFVTEVIARADPSIIMEIRSRIDQVIKTADPFTILPFLIYHLTKDEADFMVFNAAPWLLKHLLFPLVFSRKYKKAWAFAERPQEQAVKCRALMRHNSLSNCTASQTGRPSSNGVPTMTTLVLCEEYVKTNMIVAGR